LSQIKTYEVTPDVVETYRQLAKFNFDCGDYQTARDMLENYLSLFASPPKPSDNDDDDDGINDKDQNKGDTDGAGTGNAAMYYLTSINKDLLQVLWGKLSCEILVENWEEASVALTAVKTAINSLSSANKMSALEALQQRTGFCTGPFLSSGTLLPKA